MNYAGAAVIGAVSGLRSMTGSAIVSQAASRNLLRLKRTPLAWLASDGAARASALLAVGEIIADKLPFMPNRTDMPSLVWRAISGAVCGYAICGRRRSRQEAWTAAVIASTSALAASYAGLEYRRRVKLHPVAAALLEDAVAIGAGAAAVSIIGD